ncbi:acetate kinase [Sulfurimonas sp.]|uniref:acetate/propionate family kinase n=1 Tax=Sulfurimonas sp. TaxID=2022749 RepID=UPI0025D8B87A|nr:acetate kinase [Sulfurimonas sp.]MDD5156503.1 acetate kinase [Sulfurimonas sp.]
MKIAVINAGSSSVKFKLFEAKSRSVLAKVTVENIGALGSDITMSFEGKKTKDYAVIKNHHEALKQILELLKTYELLLDFSSLYAIGHRVVHGGEDFCSATLIDEQVIEKLKTLIHLAPLHNRANLEGILVTRKKAPLVKQIAVFDTAFHSKMPEEAYLYALDYELYEKHKIRKYGFHGTSHSYISRLCALEMKRDIKELNIITLHLGNGSSACAIKGGVSIDTSMGFTPLEGLVMGSRSGDIDPAVVFYMQRELGLSVDEVENILNKKSGVLGICGTNDFKAIVSSKDEKSKLALNIMSRRVKKYIGAYMALLGSVDAIVFSGGVGENSAIVRKKILENIGFGIELNGYANSSNGKIISTKNSKVQIMVIKTDEELEIVNECLSFLKS